MRHEGIVGSMAIGSQSIAAVVDDDVRICVFLLFGSCMEGKR